MTPKEIKELIDNYPAEYENGLTDIEVKDIASKIPNIDMNKVYNSMSNNTCSVIGTTLINYYSDVLLALTCGIENKDVNLND
jgi:hypothetical protein